MYKTGTGTLGRVCGTLDLGTRDEGLEDIKYGTWGSVGRGRGDVKYGDAGMRMIFAKVGGKCVISHFSREYVVVNATHPALLTNKVKLLS